MRLVGGSTPPTSAPPAGLSIEQWENARTIAEVGRRLGVGSRGIQIALMTALVESGLRDVNYGDRDSVGVFQQRSAWGSYEKRMNVAESAKMFFTGGEQGQRGLLDIKGWDQMDPGAAAQAVQVSAFPDRYAQQLGKSQQILEGLKDAAIPVTAPSTAGGGGSSGDYQTPPLPPNTEAPGGTVGAAGDSYLPPVGVGATAQPQRAPMQDAQPGTEGPLQSAYDKLIETAPGAGEAGALGSDTPQPLGVTATDQPVDFSRYASEDPELDLSGLFSPGSVDSQTFTNLTGSAAPDASTGGIRSQVLNIAKSLLGTPYVFGGNTPQQGLDCSGLVKYALNQAGIKGVPRLSQDQAAWARDRNPKANDLTGARPGDLITWGDGTGGVMDHIAFYVGKGQILEEPRPGESARIISLGNYYRNLYGGFHIVHMGKVYGD